MNRIDRISAILIQLQSRSTVTAREIADRFDISLRTVYRDIQTLEDSGIPVIGNPGVGYSLVQGFKLPPLMFTQEEALAFLAAEKLVNELTDSGNQEYYRSGMNKIRAVMRLSGRDTLEEMETNIGMLETRDMKHDGPSDVLHVLLKGILGKNVVEINYLSDHKNELLIREIEPVGIFFSHLSWYLIAFCLIRMEYRTFKINRIRNIRLLHQPFRQSHPSLKDFWKSDSRKQDLEEVVIRLDKDKALGQERYYYGLISEVESDNYIEYSFLIFSLDKFAHWYLSFADSAEIVKPEALHDMVRDIIRNISI